MSYNFKSIADTQVVAEPSESVHVLIEENGEIKRAPKTAVGGAGGSESLAILFNSGNWVGGDSGYELIYVTEGLYEKVLESLSNNCCCNLSVNRQYINESDGYVEFQTCFIRQIRYYANTDASILIEFDNCSYYIYCYPDGRIYISDWD